MLDTSEKIHIYKTALAKWGKQTQTMHFMKDASALVGELAKNLCGEKCSTAEKIAGVEIALEQIVAMLDNHASVAEHKRQLLIKLRERIKNT